MDLENAKNPDALKMLKDLADSGDYESQKLLGYAFFLGKDVNKNIYTSERWYQLAYKNVDAPKEELPEIAYYLGVIISRKGEYNEALKILESLEDNLSITPVLRGHVKCTMAEIYYDLKNYEKCKDLCEEIYYESHTPEIKFVEYGDIWPVLIRLSDIYLFEKSYARSLELFKIIEMQIGNRVLSDVFYNNYGYASEMCKDYSNAMKQYTKAYELGCIFAGLNMGNMYNEGLGVDVDKVKGSEYFEKCKKNVEKWKGARNR